MLWERGWINKTQIQQYTNDGKDVHKQDGKLKPEFECFCLRHLLKSCTDFSNETSALEYLAEQLSSRSDVTHQVLFTTKYHCEIAGEGAEYAWAFIKHHFRNLPFESKQGKDNFFASVNVAVNKVSEQLIRRFSSRARRYMLTYLHFSETINQGGQKPTYPDIEKFTKRCKTHRNIADQEKVWITKVWGRKHHCE